jgi:tetratricopeptide (TPR) repeat protein
MIDQLPVEVLECARVLRSLSQPGDRVIARKSHVAYHGEVLPLAFPFAKRLPELAAYAAENRVRWLYFSWPEAETRPELAYLLDTTATVPGLTVRCSTRPHPAVLYEIGPEFGREPAWLANDTLRAYHTVRAHLLIDPGNPRLLYQAGGLAWMLRRNPEARGLLERVVQRQPDHVEALLLLGATLVALGDPARAQAAYRRAAAISPDNPAARIGLGWVALLGGDEAEAGRQWRPVIGATRDPEVLRRMRVLYRSLGEREAEAEAAATLERLGAGS